MKRNLLKLCLVCFLSLSFNCYVKAQTDPGDPGGDPEVPLDPGSWVLAAAGVGYGIKKWRDSKQQTQNNITGIEQAIDQKEKQVDLY